MYTYVGLHVIDFERLRIENRTLHEKIDRMYIHMYTLINGYIN